MKRCNRVQLNLYETLAPRLRNPSPEAPINRWVYSSFKVHLNSLEKPEKIPEALSLSLSTLHSPYSLHTAPATTHGSGHPVHTTIQTPYPLLSYCFPTNTRTNLGIGGPLANTPRVWSIYSNLFYRNREGERRKIEDSRI